MYKKKSIILDTDIGYDPDDLIALLLLNNIARYNIELIVTANECNNKRYDFLDQILKQLNRYDIPIAPGSSLGMEKFTVNSLIDNEIHEQLNTRHFTEQMASVVRVSTETIYIGIGGFTNLAKFIEQYPVESKNMKIFMMGGALNYERHPNWVEYNVKIDPLSFKKVIESECDITYIMAQTTHNKLYEVTSHHDFYNRLQKSTGHAFKLLYEHCRLWFQKRGHGTSMHDPLTVAVALGYDFVAIQETSVTVDSLGILTENKDGYPIKYSCTESNAESFMNFLVEKLQIV